MRIEQETLILRSTKIEDIEDIISWNTVATEWMDWDAPWEHVKEDDEDWDAYRISKAKAIASQSDDVLQTRLEVCINDERETHIGVVSCYFINEEYRIDDAGTMVTIGMDIPEIKYRGHGYGKSAYQMYIDYLKTQGYKKIYTQTWSGNIPLIKMAEKLGFQECNRFVDLRQVRGKSYDGLTFVLAP